MKLTEILAPDCILAPMEAADKNDSIRQLVGLLTRIGKCHDEAEVLKAVLDREAIRSTGVGHGLAVPHGKCDGCDQLIMAFGKPADPLDFQSIDGQPVSVVVLLASPHDKTGPHIQALREISRLMLQEEFRMAIQAANNPQEIYDVFVRFEANA